MYVRWSSASNDNNITWDARILVKTSQKSRLIICIWQRINSTFERSLNAFGFTMTKNVHGLQNEHEMSRFEQFLYIVFHAKTNNRHLWNLFLFKKTKIYYLSIMMIYSQTNMKHYYDMTRKLLTHDYQGCRHQRSVRQRIPLHVPQPRPYSLHHPTHTRSYYRPCHSNRHVSRSKDSPPGS